MRSSTLLYLVPAALCAAASPLRASVVISRAPTVNMTCSGGVCYPTAADAVLNVQDLQNTLAGGNVTVTSTGVGVQAKDIRANAPLTWSTATTLALDAFRSIEINAKVRISGAGGVSVTTSDGGSGGEFACDNGAITFAHLSDNLTINGTSYTLVNSVASLASAIATNPSGAFALASNYDAKKDGTYVTSPIVTVFSGAFNGLGNRISNLSINDPTEDSYVGLFAEATPGSAISNVRLVNESVQGGSGSSVEAGSFIGGLVGYSTGGSITNSYSSGSVTGGDYVAVGGLLGLGKSTVSTSGSAANVSIGAMGNAGGLIGLANGGVTDSWATGNVSGVGMYIGGLIGLDDSPAIERSWASGQVLGNGSYAYVGGLVGINLSATVTQSRASGAVLCQATCMAGGLIGREGGAGIPEISQSFASGSVTASATDGAAGGLVGFNFAGEVSNSYASGAVAAGEAGGLVARNESAPPNRSISNSYAIGAVSGTSGETGGLIGYDDEYGTSTLKRTYWDMTTSGITDPSQGSGNVPNDPGIKGLTDAQLKSGLPRGFSPKIWSENSGINGGLPYLINNPPKN